MHVKRLELPAYDPRGAKAHGLNLLTANLGADHNSGYGSQEVFGAPFPFAVDRFSTERKGELCKWNQDLTAFVETGIMCTFIPALGMANPETYGKLLATATGVMDFADPAYLWKVGERIFNLERLFNMREGFSRKDDSFPDRFTQEKMAAGPSAGQVFELDTLLDQYYQVRGWDKNGVPGKAKLQELGIA
jgi:aldehyde:ferredoxin oxidoreductase